MKALSRSLAEWGQQLLFSAILTAFSAFSLVMASAQEIEPASHHEHERPPLPMETRIAIEVDSEDGVLAKVTLVFPDNGFRVPDWGNPARHHNQIKVAVLIERHNGMLPVVTEIKNVYRLGHLPPGDYEFQVTSAGHTLGQEKFTVKEEPHEPPPFPASARLHVTVHNDGLVSAAVRVVFHEAGWRIRDWGTPMRRGSFFTILAEAVRVDHLHDEAEHLIEARHTYRLWPEPLEPGEYHLQFFLNDHELAHAGFRLPQTHGKVSLHAGPLTEPGHSTHPLRVVYQHPGGIDTHSLGDRNIRVVGPNGYDRFATLKGWAPLENAAHDLEHEWHGAMPGVVATYLVHAPGRAWTAHDNGPYAVALAPNSVRSKGDGVDVLIGFHGPITDEDVELVEAAGGHVRRIFSSINAMSATIPKQAFADLAAHPRVRYVERDGLAHPLDPIHSDIGNGEAGDAPQPGDYFPGQRLGGFRVDIPREPHPPVTFQSIEIVELPSDEGAFYGATVTLIVPSGDVHIRWGGLNREHNRFWIDVEAFREGVGVMIPLERRHTYELGRLRPGEYDFAVYLHGRLIGHKRFAIEPEMLPQARVVSENMVEPSENPHRFRIRFFSPHGMDEASVRAAQVRVVGPHEYAERADLLSISTHEGPDHREFTEATYSVAPPPHGWIARYNGSYGVYLQRNTAHDNEGNFLPGGRVGGFFVMIDHHPPPPPERPRLDFTLRVDDDGVAFANLEFHPGSSGWTVLKWGDRVHLKGHTFVARAEIGEATVLPALVATHTYRLGRLTPGFYEFVLYGSNGFVSRHPFRIGDDDPHLTPYDQWRRAAEELMEENGDPAHELEDRLGLFHYAFALDPADSVGKGLVRASVETRPNGQRTLVLEHPEVPTATDLVYRVELSEDLEKWNDGTDLLLVRDLRLDADGTYRRTLELVEEEDGPPYRFARLRVWLRDE